MTNLYAILGLLDNNDFSKLQDFVEFAKRYVDFIASNQLQADIVSKNESNYHFFQYGEEGKYCITRPINTNLFLDTDVFDECEKDFLYALRHIKDIKDEVQIRENINKFVYTCQQSIGASLDAFNNPNKARKRNGTLFEVLVRCVINETGVDVSTDEEELAMVDEKTPMKFQHDVIIKNEEEEVKAIGQLKTTSKDRLDKIFLEKYMHKKLNDVEIPHFAVFLNDIQRKGKSPQYGINSTFLPGHFKAYTVHLNPLDGVYYFDLRPNMRSDELLSKYIKSFDNLLVEDMWKFIEK